METDDTVSLWHAVVIGVCVAIVGVGVGVGATLHFVERGPEGAEGDRGPVGARGPQGPVPDVSAETADLDGRVFDLENADLDSRVSELESSVDEINSVVSDPCLVDPINC